MNTKRVAVALAVLAALFSSGVQQADACTRATYIGPDNMVVTGRTMDWKEDIMSNIYVFPRGIQRAGYNKGETVKWTSKYGSVIATGYDIGTCDGMNEKGLVASLLFLPESIYDRPGDTRPTMGISIWTQYVLDNFATVREAVDELKKETFRIDAPQMPNGSASTLHLAITDETGNTAILEYLNGELNIHESKEYQVMTNSPRYEYQLAINDYWKEVGGLQMLPGTNRSSDRFVRASFYIHAIPQTADAKIAVPSVLSVMRTVSVPFGITTPEGQQKGAEICKKHGIDAIVVIGGDGSFKGAQKLAALGINTIGLPGTIDLDIACTDYTIGFDTAVNTAMEAIDKVRDTSTSHERCSIIEVMGRGAGHIALWCGLANGAEEILLPEKYDYDEQRLIDQVVNARKNGKQHYIIVNAEGIGHSQSMAKRIEEATGVETRATILGHMQRGGSPTCKDRVYATTMGAMAVDLLCEGKSNRVIGHKGGKFVDFDIDEALAMKKDVDEYMYEISKTLV